METQELGQIIAAEVVRSCQIGADQFIGGLTPGLFLAPFPIVIASVGFLAIDAMETTAHQLSRAPARIIARILTAQLRVKDRTKVVRLDVAARFAADIATGSVFNLSGDVPPPGTHAAVRLSHLKGIRKLVRTTGTKLLLGSVLYKLLQIIRAPTVFAVRLAAIIWNLILVIMGVGAVCVVYDLVAADWEAIALSQTHPRQRQRVTISRRL